MKTFILSDNSIITARGFIPENALAEVPDWVDKEDYPFLYAEQELNQETQELVWVVKFNESAANQSEAEAEIAAEERKWAELRLERNKKLSACDYTQLPDSPFSSEQIAEWALYRQELRDLPDNVLDIDNAIWPSQPEN